MNKKLNTVLFILGASVLNVLLMLILMALGMILISLVLPENVSQGLASILYILILVLSVAGSFFIYHRGIRFLSKKIDMDKYFHPIFKRRKR